MKSKLKLLTVFLISTFLLLAIFLFVSPEGKPLIYVFIPVILLWVMLYSAIKLLMDVFLTKTTKLHSVIAFVSVSFAVLLFLLSGIGQLSTRDVVLVVTLGVVSGFYFYRTWV